METTKTCPKCTQSTPMEKAAAVAVLPALRDPKYSRQPTPLSETEGLPVQAYVCPVCEFVELYHVQAQGS